MKNLLIVTAIVEVGVGLALLFAPSLVTQLLFAADITGAAIPLGRVTGVLLLALSAAWWLARGDAESRAGRALLTAMLIYDVGVTGILVILIVESQNVGILLWPVVIFHVAMVVWCVALRRREPAHTH
jgi:hypothetical protein